MSDKTLSDQIAADLLRFRFSYERLFSLRSLVGRNPPNPGTLRARIGVYAVKIVQGLLFWYTPQIQAFHHAVVQHQESLFTLIENGLEREAQRFRQHHDLVQSIAKSKLNRSFAVGESPATSAATAIRHSNGDRVAPDELTADFHFWLQDKFRGSEEETTSKLRNHLDRIFELHPEAKEGVWLDIGAGRGEWLKLASAIAGEAKGCDTGELSTAYCQNQGLAVERCGAIDFLAGQAPRSADVITVIHVAEHWPSEYLLKFMRIACRTLKDGGLVLLETPNPANLAMATSDFWLDPTHIRPIPRRYLHFVLEYFGMEIALSEEINYRDSQQLRDFANLPWMSDIAPRFLGAQDYVIVGRRRSDAQEHSVGG